MLLCILRHRVGRWTVAILMLVHQTCVPVLLTVEDGVCQVHMYVWIALLHYLVGGHGFLLLFFVLCKWEWHSEEIVHHS